MKMNKTILGAMLLLSGSLGFAQGHREVPQKIKRPASSGETRVMKMDKKPLTPQQLWELGRVAPAGLTADTKELLYTVGKYSLEENSVKKKMFRIPVAGGNPTLYEGEHIGGEILDVSADGTILYVLKGDLWKMDLDGANASQLTHTEGKLENVKLSPDQKHILYSQSVLVNSYYSKDKYKDLPKSDVYIYDNLDFRHWDSFNDGRFNHPFVATYDNGNLGEPVDLLADQPFYSPQAPFGGAEDFAWSPDSKAVLYVCKKKFGKEYATSTNTDIYRYELSSGETTNITEGMMGYDTNPSYSPNGKYLAWQSMKTDGYESDKNDIVVFDRQDQLRLNLTAHWDGTVNSYVWSKDGRKLYFTAPTKGTIQLFAVKMPANLRVRSLPAIEQLSEGNFDITGIVGEDEAGLIVTSTSLTRASEIYHFGFKKKQLVPITTVNDREYLQIAETNVEGRFTKASDGEDLFSWVVYPPDFDKNKSYPTLLYCQGGPQSAVSQFYSLRWNLQLIASQGYIVVAPNRRGMPGWGVKWNADISKDWGGQSIRDYLSAIDDISKESYVDTTRLGAIGASYGGYSVFYLAGVHEGRFKTFISHCGLFDMTSWYGTTEELFFANHDLGGPYWDAANEKSYTAFNPIKHIDQWNTPILIFQGGKDYRVPIGQGLSAFQAAQLKGIKSRLVYLPEENHWVLSGHNAQVWQREFFSWLKETL